MDLLFGEDKTGVFTGRVGRGDLRVCTFCSFFFFAGIWIVAQAHASLERHRADKWTSLEGPEKTWRVTWEKKEKGSVLHPTAHHGLGARQETRRRRRAQRHPGRCSLTPQRQRRPLPRQRRHPAARAHGPRPERQDASSQQRHRYAGLHALPPQALRPQRLRLCRRLPHPAHPVHHRGASRPRIPPFLPQWANYRRVRGHARRSVFLGDERRSGGEEVRIQRQSGGV